MTDHDPALIEKAALVLIGAAPEWQPTGDLTEQAWNEAKDDARAVLDAVADDLRAEAWDEGFEAGERDVFEHETFNEPCISNPYRKEADHECDSGYFDRTLCGCGAMHSYCDTCGKRDGDCPLDTEADR